MTRLSLLLCLLSLPGCASDGMLTSLAPAFQTMLEPPPDLEERPVVRLQASESDEESAVIAKMGDESEADAQEQLEAEAKRTVEIEGSPTLPPPLGPPLLVAPAPEPLVDASTINNSVGIYGGAGARLDPLSGTGGLGLFHYPTSWLSWRAGIAGAAFTSSDENLFAGGGELGLRVQTPTQLAPFVGVGTFLGWQETKTTTTVSDESFWGFHNTTTTTNTKYKGLATIYPEVGVIFWISPRVYIATRAAYNVTSLKHDKESWMLGLEFGLRGKADMQEDHDKVQCQKRL